MYNLFRLFLEFETKAVLVSKERTENLTIKLLNLKRHWPFVTAREIAACVGSIVSMRTVLLDDSLFYTRFLQHIVNFRNLNEIPWNKIFNVTIVPMHEKALQELHFLLENFEDLNVRSFSPTPFSETIKVFGDASNKGLGGYFDIEGKRIPYGRNLEEFEIAKSSTYRELLCLKYAVENLPADLKCSDILYITDSQTCETIIRKGSSKVDLHVLAKEILDSVKLRGLKVVVAWVPRLHNSVADMYSNLIDYDDWSLSDDLFRKIVTLTSFNFDLDVFANHNNSRCEKFYSRFYCKNTAGINSLKFSWNSNTVWAVPPPRIAHLALMHMVKCRSKGVFVVPRWEGQGYWALLKSDYFQRFVKKQVDFPGRKYIIPGSSGNEVFQDFNGILSVFVIDCFKL